jgi:hypothetical protein
MISVHFDGDGPTTVSPQTIRTHQSKPAKLVARNMNDALRLTGLSWEGEGVAICTDARNDEQQHRYLEQLGRALDAKVRRDQNSNPDLSR